MSDTEFVDGEEVTSEAKQDSQVSQASIQSCEISECKELQQPVPLAASHCRKGVFVMMKECPCKVNDLKISKTGKHGSTKANMVGYDIITGRKYQETVPGHTSMWGFTPVKVEYEVAAIQDGVITAMTPEGTEHFFNVPETDYRQQLVKEFKSNADKGGDLFWTITVVYAPRGNEKKWMANMHVESYKLGKED
jgi:translation elongation factor P/translation initiation factor 5A